MRTWLIVLLVATVALLAVEVGAEPQFDDEGVPSRVFNFFRRIFRRRFDDDDDGEEDRGSRGIFGFILRLLNSLGDDDDSDAEAVDTVTGTSGRMRMMVRGRRGMRRFLHTFFGTVANYGFAFTCGGSQECIQCVMNNPGGNITRSQEFRDCVPTILRCTEQCYDVLEECARSIPQIAACFNTIP